MIAFKSITTAILVGLVQVAMLSADLRAGCQSEPDDRPKRPPPRHLGPESVDDEPAAVTTEEAERILRFIGEHFSDRWHGRLVRLKERDADEFRNAVQFVAPRMRELMATFDRNPTLGALLIEEDKLRFRVFKAVAHYHDAEDEASRERHRREIHGLLLQQFEVEQAIHYEEIRDLDRRLRDQRDCHERRANEKDDIVEKRLERALSVDPRDEHHRHGRPRHRDGKPRQDRPKPSP